MCISVYDCDCDQSSGPLKVPLWTPKGFMDPRLRTPGVDEYIKDNMINSIFGRNSLCSCCYSLKPAKRILLQMLHPEKETCLSQTHKNVKPKRVSK